MKMSSSLFRVGEPMPRGGILSGEPVAVALTNLTRATSSVGEVQIGDSCLSEVTVGRRRVLAHALGGQERKAYSKVSLSVEHLGHVGAAGSFQQDRRCAAR